MNTIKLKYGLEEITARVPGLFPYLEFDENHVCTIHPASDSNSGCYGKIACSIDIPSDVNLDADNQHIVVSGNSYTYTSLMGYYYKYKDEFPTNSFIQFMDTGIGKFEISKLLPIDIGGEMRTIDFDECILVPEYEYYANASRLYDMYTKIKTMCDKYKQIKAATGEINCELECLLDRFDKMGGDVMLEFYRLRANEASQISQTYYSYASKTFNLNFDVNIVSTNNDLGVLNTFLNYFNPNEMYYDGDEVIYNDRTYICIVGEGLYHKGPWENRHFHLISDTDSNNQETVYIPKFNSNEYYHRGEFVRISDNGQVYVCDLPEYIQYNVGGVITIGDKYFIKNGDEYEEDDTLTLPYVIQNGDKYYYKGPEIYHGAWSYDVFKPKDLTGKTISKLTGFRNSNNFIDAGGNIRRPDYNYDWLWYYHIGDIGFYETTTDSFNNIMLLTGTSEPTVNIGEYETNLMAYGDILTDIIRDTTNNTITFNYVIGAHFKAKYIHSYLDDDNNSHYCYGEFEYDDNDLHGVRYTETYTYDGEIADLSDDDFNKYVSYNKYKLYPGGSNIKVGEIYYLLINGEYTQFINNTHDIIPVPVNNRFFYCEQWAPARRIDDTYKQCEFFVGDTTRMVYETYNGAERNGLEIIDSPVIGDIICKFDDNKDNLCSTITKFDYLTGIPYRPNVKSDVRVNRGNASAWERHMKLGELKTFEDLETYSNGGFFNLR